MLQRADDDATLTQLVVAWVHVAQGGKRYQEAAYIFDELIDKYQVRNNPSTAYLWGRESYSRSPCSQIAVQNLVLYRKV